MLGSLHDSEDALQETLLRVWRGLAGFEEERNLRPWLYRIATNVCIDLLAKRTQRVLPPDARPAADPTAGPGHQLLDAPWVEPFPDDVLEIQAGYASPEAHYEERESVELAFIAALQHVPPNQRAVLLLRDVLGLSARETAEALDTSQASANSALQRARKTVSERLPAQSQQATLRELGDRKLRRLVEAYIQAWEQRDQTPGLRHIETRANAQPAIGWYLWDEDEERFAAAAIEVYSFAGERLTQIAAFAAPELFQRFALPADLAA